MTLTKAEIKLIAQDLDAKNIPMSDNTLLDFMRYGSPKLWHLKQRLIDVVYDESGKPRDLPKPQPSQATTAQPKKYSAVFPIQSILIDVVE